MKQFTFIVLLIFVSSLCFGQENGRKKISVLTNPIYEVFDIGYAFADNTPETFELLADVEVQVPVTEKIEIVVCEKFLIDRYAESYRQISTETLIDKIAVQVENTVDVGVRYKFKGTAGVSGTVGTDPSICKVVSGPFVTLFPRFEYVNVTCQENRADFLLFGGGIDGGYEWNFTSDFKLKVYGGLCKTGIIPLNSDSKYSLCNKYDFLGLPFEVLLGCRIGFEI